MKYKMLLPLVIVFSILALSPVVSFAQASNPMPPKDMVAQIQGNSVSLNWTPPFDTTVVGYNVYRKDDLAASDFTRINSTLLSNPSFSDRTVRKGRSYTYQCKAINADGTESEASNVTSAPQMKMNNTAVVTHMGRPVRIASPGDVIKYNIDFVNQGFGVARNVVIVYAIPKGTTLISGTASLTKYKVKVAYYDESKKNWVDNVKKEGDISKIRFTVLEDVFPIEKEKNDTASLKVLVNY